MNNLNATNALGGIAPKANLKAPAQNAEAPKATLKDLDKAPDQKSLVNARLGEGWEKFASTKAEGKQYDLSGLTKNAPGAPPAEHQGLKGGGGGGGGVAHGDAAAEKAVPGEAKTAQTQAQAPSPAPSTPKAAQPENRATTAQPSPERGAQAQGREAQVGPQREPASPRAMPPLETQTAQPQTQQPQAPAAQAPTSQAPTSQAAPQPQQATPAPMPQAPAPSMPAAAAAVLREAPAAPQQVGAAMPTVAPPPPEAAGRQLHGQAVTNPSPTSYTRQDMSRQSLFQNRTAPPPQGEGAHAPQDASTMLAARAKEQLLMQGLQQKPETGKPQKAAEQPKVEDRKVEEKEPGRRCPQCAAELGSEPCGACPVCRMGAPEVLHLATAYPPRKGERLAITTVRPPGSGWAGDSPAITLHRIPAFPATQDVLLLAPAS